MVDSKSVPTHASMVLLGIKTDGDKFDDNADVSTSII